MFSVQYFIFFTFLELNIRFALRNHSKKKCRLFLTDKHQTLPVYIQYCNYIASVINWDTPHFSSANNVLNAHFAPPVGLRKRKTRTFSGVGSWGKL